MLIVQDKFISLDVIEEQFLCNLSACKGACCWEGDFGAPLEAKELDKLVEIYEDVKEFLLPEAIKQIEDIGLYAYYEEAKEYGTTLMPSGACVFMTREKNGTAKCGIEQAYKAGATDFYKPISCHLYPIRIHKNEGVNFEALNYDRWDICSAACELGKKEQLPVYKFLKHAIVRKYGEAFYAELEAAAAYTKEKK